MLVLRPCCEQDQVLHLEHWVLIAYLAMNRFGNMSLSGELLLALQLAQSAGASRVKGCSNS